MSVWFDRRTRRIMHGKYAGERLGALPESYLGGLLKTPGVLTHNDALLVETEFRARDFRSDFARGDGSLIETFGGAR